MTFRFSSRSLRNLAGVHPDLVRVAHRALELSPLDFVVTEGVRTLERQRQLVASGASRTMNSRHLTGHALDFAPIVARQIRWDWPLFPQVANAFKAAASEKGVQLVWGGDWTTFVDGPHIELDRRVYT
jgi:peptidoglycan L-alanyl-D-glutamate endopeptidase CwlK